MASATETMMLAFVALLTGLSDVPGVPSRNNPLPERMSEFKSGKSFFNVLDGDGVVTDVALGGGAMKYSCQQTPVVEWVYQDDDDSAREANFDLGLIAIYDAVTAEGAIPGVNVIADEPPQRSNLNTDGLPNTKAAAMKFQLEFVSARPF